jgi:NitT/TauT family transport system permease protein
MKRKLIKAFIPNRNVDYNISMMILVFWIVSVLSFWIFSEHHLLPTPVEIITAAKRLAVQRAFVQELMTSAFVCIKAMFYSIGISLSIAMISTLAFFRPMANFVAKNRFLTAVGLSFLFSQVTDDTSGQKMALMVFGISVFLTTSFIGITSEVKKEELDYARTLKMNEWESLWHVVILGKADLFLEAVRQNFAIAWLMLPMVENICRAEGGIGVLLFDENRVFHLDGVYAIQIVILLVGIFLDWLFGFMRRIFCPYSVLTLDRK